MTKKKKTEVKTTSEVSTVTVDIYAQRYLIRSDGDGEYIASLAEQVDEKMKEISSATMTADSLKVALLTSIHLADENYQLRHPLELPDPKSLETTFDFPEEVKLPCEQYLLYFAQFLRDLGISATSEIKDKAGKVLFSIRPIDDKEALNKIREALSIYLSLPSSPIIYEDKDSFPAMRLQQQIENLHHAQKMASREMQLAEKVIQVQSDTIREKNLTVSQKDSLIDLQGRIIEKITSKSVMMNSLENNGEFEKILDGLEVGESKWLKENFGIKFNALTSMKSLGSKLTGKDSEIISLNLVRPAGEK